MQTITCIATTSQVIWPAGSDHGRMFCGEDGSVEVSVYPIGEAFSWINLDLARHELFVPRGETAPDFRVVRVPGVSIEILGFAEYEITLSAEYKRKRQKEVRMNTNPSLILGLAQAHAETLDAGLQPGDRTNLELRIYPDNGTGYWFTSVRAPARWYYKEEADADHFTRADLDELAAAIAAGARVQLLGYHSLPLATWRDWSSFETAIS